MLNYYNRDQEFFKNQSKKIKIIRSIDLYNEFNNLGDYFNNELKVKFEEALQTSLKIVPNKFLVNVGDSTIKWVDIVDIIDEDSIELNKLKNITPRSILCSDNVGQIFPLTCVEDYSILFARYNNTHIWRKLINDDIEMDTITGIKINKLSELNLTDNLANDFVSDNTIDSINIDDNAIDISKTAYNTLSLDRIAIQSEINSGLIPDKYNVGGSKDGVASLDAFVNKCLLPSKILDNSIDINIHPNLFHSRYYSDNPLYLFEREKNEFPENSYDTNNYEILEYFNIAPETIDDDFLDTYENIGSIDNLPWFNDGRNPQEPRYFQKGYVHPTPDCRVEGRLIPLGGLRLRHFDDEVRAALIAKGVTDND
jgi:hypothetical protein